MDFGSFLRRFQSDDEAEADAQNECHKAIRDEFDAEEAEKAKKAIEEKAIEDERHDTCTEDRQERMKLEDYYDINSIPPAVFRKVKRKFGNRAIDVIINEIKIYRIPFDELLEKPEEGEQDNVEDAEPDEDANLDSDVDDCILMSGLQEALAAKAEQAVKVEQVEEQAEPEEIEQAEEGTGAASSNKRKDTRVRPGRKRRELNV